MEIKVGVFYKTRNGYKARIYATDSGDCYPIHGAIQYNNIWSFNCWDEDGRIYSNTTSEKDLISEWEEPKPKLKAWVSHFDGSVLFLKEGAPTPDNPSFQRAPWLDEPDQSDKK